MALERSEGSQPEATLRHSRLAMLPEPRVVYATDFSSEFRYHVPHRHDTSSQAKLLHDGVLTVQIKPGMHGASSDAPRVERAEYSHPLSPHALVRQSFRVKVDSDFAAPRRTMIAQIKPDPISPLSPPLSLYLSDGGSVKWVEYETGGQGQDQHHVSLRDHGIDLLDGRWHAVTMEYLRSDEDGYCRVAVDQHIVVEQRGYCSNPGGDKLNARIGVYRDAMPIVQRVHFDDWNVAVLAEEERREQ